MAKTRQQAQSVVVSNLNVAQAPITAARHRIVETEMLNYMSDRILAGGLTNAAEPGGSDPIFRITYPFTFPNTEYIIVGHLVSLSSNFDADNDAVWTILTKTTTGFTGITYEWNGGYQQVALSWLAISTPGVTPPTRY